MTLAGLAPRLLKVTLLVFLLFGSSGCGYLFTHAPPPDYRELQDFSCTESNGGPIIDAIWAGLNLAGAHAVHPLDPATKIFGRDLLEVEIYNPSRTKRLFTLYNNHLKSHFVPFDQDPVAGAAAANQRRQRQAETVARIVEARMRPNSRFIVLGDMNDPPDSAWTAPLVAAAGLGLVDALQNPQEVRPEGASGALPQQARWTHRYKASGQPAEYELNDQIWLSPVLADRQIGAWIHRRKNLTGYGSDHDPAWVELDV